MAYFAVNWHERYFSGEDLNLSATFGYAPQSERFVGSVQFRWIPFKPAPPVK